MPPTAKQQHHTFPCMASLRYTMCVSIPWSDLACLAHHHTIVAVLCEVFLKTSHYVVTSALYRLKLPSRHLARRCTKPGSCHMGRSPISSSGRRGSMQLALRPCKPSPWTSLHPPSSASPWSQSRSVSFRLGCAIHTQLATWQAVRSCNQHTFSCSAEDHAETCPCLQTCLTVTYWAGALLSVASP